MSRKNIIDRVLNRPSESRGSQPSGLLLVLFVEAKRIKPFLFGNISPAFEKAGEIRGVGAPPPTYTRKACVPLASQAFLEAAKPYPVSDGYLRIARLCTLDRVCIKYRPMSATIQTVRLKYDFCC